MLADLIAATTPPTAPGPHDAYDWWSDIWLPAVVGLGSLAIAGVAVRVATRSNRLAAAATEAATKSNAIAERAVQADQARADEARAESQRQERRRLGDRYLVHLDELSAEMHSDPTLWERPLEEIDDNALFRMSPVIFEATARGWSDFPSSVAVELVRSAAKAGGGTRRTQLARNAAHTIVNFWIEDPATSDGMIEFVRKDTAERIV